MKIVHIITGLGSGGAERMLVKLVKNMSPSFQNYVISLSNDNYWEKELEKAGARVYFYPLTNISGPFNLIRCLYKINSIKPSIIQSWLYHGDFVALIAASVYRKAQLCWNIRCSDMELSNYSIKTKFIQKLLAHYSAKPRIIISNSHAGMNSHLKLGYQNPAWTIIPNGFNTEQFKPRVHTCHDLRQTLGLKTGTRLIGQIARFDKQKNYPLFFAAASLIASKHQDIHFVCIGRGVDNHNPELNLWLKELNLSSRVHLLGEQNGLEEYLPQLDLVTLTSSYGEGFPNSLGEAMASGTPCVATDVGDTRILIDKTGQVVPIESPKQLADACLDILGMAPRKRDELGALARNRIIENFSIDKITQTYEKLYLELC